MPEVSVVIPTYNREAFLEEAIQSVLNQTFEDFELIVVDDGSTDDTRSLVARFRRDGRVSYVYQDNQGDGAARNTGIRRSSGVYVVFLDSDDLWFPEKLERQVGLLRQDLEFSAAYSAITLQRLNRDRRVVRQRVVRRPEPWQQTLFEDLLYDNVITGSHSSVMVPRKAFDRVGYFDESLNICDMDMWRRLALELNFRYIDEPLVCIRKHDSNVSSDSGLMADNSVRYLAKLYRELPQPFRHHLPRVAMATYAGSAFRLFRSGRVSTGLNLLGRMMSHGARHPLVFSTIVFQLGCRGLARRGVQVGAGAHSHLARTPVGGRGRLRTRWRELPSSRSPVVRRESHRDRRFPLPARRRGIDSHPSRLPPAGGG